MLSAFSKTEDKEDNLSKDSWKSPNPCLDARLSVLINLSSIFFSEFAVFLFFLLKLRYFLFSTNMTINQTGQYEKIVLNLLYFGFIRMKLQALRVRI